MGLNLLSCFSLPNSPHQFIFRLLPHLSPLPSLLSSSAWLLFWSFHPSTILSLLCHLVSELLVLYLPCLLFSWAFQFGARAMPRDLVERTCSSIYSIVCEPCHKTGMKKSPFLIETLLSEAFTRILLQSKRHLKSGNARELRSLQ